MLNVSPIYNEWLRALGMPAFGALMIAAGTRVTRLGAWLRNGLPVVAVSVAVLAMAVHYQPLRSHLGPAAERIGGETTVVCYALLLLVGIARVKSRGRILSLGTGLAFTVVTLFAVFPLYWHYFGQRLRANYPDKDGNLQQTTGFTCAPTAAAMLLSQYGFHVSEGVLAERSGTNPVIGTNEFSLARALESVTANGLAAQAGHLSYHQALALNRPFVAYVLVPSIGGHAVVVNVLHADSVSILDPLSGGQERLSVQDFKEEWKGTAIWMSRRK